MRGQFHRQGPQGSQPVELSPTQNHLFTWVMCVDRCLFVPVKPVRRRCCGLNRVDVIQEPATRLSQNTALIRYWWPAQIILQWDVFMPLMAWDQNVTPVWQFHTKSLRLQVCKKSKNEATCSSSSTSSLLYCVCFYMFEHKRPTRLL